MTELLFRPKLGEYCHHFKMKFLMVFEVIQGSSEVISKNCHMDLKFGGYSYSHHLGQFFYSILDSSEVMQESSEVIII